MYQVIIPVAPKKRKKEVDQLMDIGYTEEQAVFALEANSNNVAKATEFLLENVPNSNKSNKKKNDSDNGKSKKDEDKEEENFWVGTEGFLARFYTYINLRFITCPSYCLIW